jgi:hypothetical protein
MGHLSCNVGCENIPYFGGLNPGEFSAHHITDSTFKIDLGGSGGGSTSVN